MHSTPYTHSHTHTVRKELSPWTARKCCSFTTKREGEVICNQCPFLQEASEIIPRAQHWGHIPLVLFSIHLVNTLHCIWPLMQEPGQFVFFTLLSGSPCIRDDVLLAAPMFSSEFIVMYLHFRRRPLMLTAVLPVDVSPRRFPS